MSIDRLNKAASAAGFVMATPDDEALPETAEAKDPAVPARSIVVAQPSAGLLSSDAVSSITNWIKGHVPGLGGRQPA